MGSLPKRVEAVIAGKVGQRHIKGHGFRLGCPTCPEGFVYRVCIIVHQLPPPPPSSQALPIFFCLITGSLEAVGDFEKRVFEM